MMNDVPDQRPGELNVGEPHPAAYSALEWLSTIPVTKLMMYHEASASTAIEGNRLAEVCAETLHRFLKGERVSDRYLIGLAWTIRYMDIQDNDVSVPTV